MSMYTNFIFLISLLCIYSRNIVCTSYQWKIIFSYYSRRVLQATTGIEDFGSIRWELFGAVLVAWVTFWCYIRRRLLWMFLIYKWSKLTVVMPSISGVGLFLYLEIGQGNRKGCVFYSNSAISSLICISHPGRHIRRSYGWNTLPAQSKMVQDARLKGTKY